MGLLFSRKKPREDKITEQDKAVLELKHQRDKIQQWQKKITLNLEKERHLAKELLKQGKKDRAKLLLKKKRYQEQLLEKTDNQLDNLEKMVQDLEFAQIQVKVVEGLKQGNESLDKLHKLMPIEEVERIMEDTEEAISYQNEINELLSQNLTQEDEDAVLAELDALVEAQTLPDVPTTDVPTTDEDLQLPDIPHHEPGEGEEAVQEKKQKPKAELLAA